MAPGHLQPHNALSSEGLSSSSAADLHHGVFCVFTKLAARKPRMEFCYFPAIDTMTAMTALCLPRAKSPAAAAAQLEAGRHQPSVALLNLPEPRPPRRTRRSENLPLGVWSNVWGMNLSALSPSQRALPLGHLGFGFGFFAGWLGHQQRERGHHPPQT